MKRPLDRLAEAVARGEILLPEMFEVDLDEALEGQESDPFEGEWLRVHGWLEAKRGALSEADAALIDKTAETAYRRTFDLTSNPDVSGAVSEDIEAVAMALALGYNDPWLNGLWSSFRSGRLPYGDIEVVAGDLAQLIP